MKILVSVPPALVGKFNDVSGLLDRECFATSDPEGLKLGSGGGTAHLVYEGWRQSKTSTALESWMDQEKRMVLHAGGQSRRLPAYGPSGKALIPVPVFRWAYGQRIDQSLMDLQMPLLSRILENAPDRSRWLIASGDVLVWHEGPIPSIPDADVVCVGLSESAEKVTGHGVFFTSRQDATHLKYMLQKPTVEEVGNRALDSLYFIDVGIWVLSKKAMLALMKKSGWDEVKQQFEHGFPWEYDLYSDFGLALGSVPSRSDPELADLSCAVIPMHTAEFYHFGRNSDIIHSALELQERVNDPKRIHSPLIKPNPAIFVQNSQLSADLNANMREIWIENSSIGSGWQLHGEHVLTGIPENDWKIDLAVGTCLDVVPVGVGSAIRPYGFDDAFRGVLNDGKTCWLGVPFSEWCQDHEVTFAELGCDPDVDIQFAPLFPVFDHFNDAEKMVCWILHSNRADAENAAVIRDQYLGMKRVSADWLNSHADMEALFAQRKQLMIQSFPLLLKHSDRNIFHQIDLAHAAGLFAKSDFVLPEATPDSESRLFAYIRDRMFRYAVCRHRGSIVEDFEKQAFRALQEAIIDRFRVQTHCRKPENTALSDQVIWARSPVRLDLAGGWSDTPPYCLLNGGSVVNVAVELNGQPPIQVFARVCETPHIVLRSIDLGVSETLKSYEDIQGYSLGSGFAIPKAALALAGFHPEFQSVSAFPDLETQLKEFGGGIEISLLCAVPKGSGLGTSSILSATVLGALSDLCGLGWERFDIADRTSAIEQMLTSGGGWQDQFGGILHGIKHLRTDSGLQQVPDVRWLPDYLFTNPVYQQCMLLYYTGITRVAKNVLAEIVRGMFLNQRETLYQLNQIYEHATAMRVLIEKSDFQGFGSAIQRSWKLNQALDAGTNPPEVECILNPIRDWLLGGKLLGAGGGGYFLWVAKDPEAAARIRNYLEQNRPNPRARFVDFSISKVGLQITRS